MYRINGNLITALRRLCGRDEGTAPRGRSRKLFAAGCEALRRRREETGTLHADAPTGAFAGALLGCLTTECLSASGIVPVIASALATVMWCFPLLATRATCLFAEAFFPAIYGGAFAGMTPIAWLGGSASGVAVASICAFSAALSLVCGLVFFVVARLDSRSAAPFGAGCGGRLGMIAVVASILFVELVRPLGADTIRFHTVAADAIDVEPWSALQGFVACLIGSSATLFVLRRPRVADGAAARRILIASVVALLGLMVLRIYNRDNATAMDAFYAGCFLGMSRLDRLKGWFQPVFGVVLLMVLLVPVRGYLPGFGGGLGLAAFIAVMMIIALSRATAWMTRDMLMGERSFATGVASAAAAFLTIGLISAEPLAEDVPISAGVTAPGSIAEMSDAPSVRLVVGKPAPGAADDPIPIGISLINAAEDDVVLLTGLPAGSSMTNGRPAATGGWHLLAGELANATIRPAQGFVGGADITAVLRRANQTIIDRQTLHLEWAPRATTDVAPPLAAALPARKTPDAVTENYDAMPRAFLRSAARTAAENLGAAHPARRAAVKQTARDQQVHSLASTNPRLSAFAAAAVRPFRMMVRRADISARQKPARPKDARPATDPARPTAAR